MDNMNGIIIEENKLDKIRTDKINIIINEDEYVIPYGIKYNIVLKQPDDALSKMYEEKSELIINLRVPTNEYKDEDLQELISWSNLSNLDDGYFRNLAMYMRLNEKLERTVVFTHAYISLNKKVNTKADYVDIELIVNQRGDKLSSVTFGEGLEDTLKVAKERVENPPRVNVIVPVVVGEIEGMSQLMEIDGGGAYVVPISNTTIPTGTTKQQTTIVSSTKVETKPEDVKIYYFKKSEPPKILEGEVRGGKTYTKKYPGLETEDTDLKFSTYTKADDMEVGNKKLEQMKLITGIDETQIELCSSNNVELLKAHFRMLMEFNSKNPYRKFASDMCDLFITGTGDDYIDESLTNIVETHESTVNCMNYIKNTVNTYLENNQDNMEDIGNGVYVNLHYGDLKRPSFETLDDKLNGLTIMIHATWGINVYMTTDKKLNIYVYDHFGLDDTDLDFFGKYATDIEEIPDYLWETTKAFGNVTINGRNFSAWYCLQKFEGFNKAYKPFLTKFEWEDSL